MTSHSINIKQRSVTEKYFILACLISTIPIWLVKYPPLVDIPQHAAQVNTFLKLLNGTEFFESIYKINFLTPYWLGYIVIAFFASFMPLLTAIKITLSLSVAATPWAASRLRSCVSQDNSLDWLFLTLGYNICFEWGFINFILGAPLALLFFELSIKYFNKPNSKTIILIVLFSHLLLATHVLLLAYCILISLLMLIAHSKNSLEFTKRSLPLLSTLPIIIIWFFYTLKHEPQMHHPITWTGGNLLVFFSNFLGTSYSKDIGFITGIVSLAFPLLLGCKINLNWRAIPFIITAFIIIFSPAFFLGCFAPGSRFCIFALPFYIFSLTTTEQKRNNRAVIFILISSVMLLCISKNIMETKKDFNALDQILNKMQAHKKTIGLIFDPNINGTDLPLFRHAASWYQALNSGLADVSFANFYALVVRYKSGTPHTQINDVIAVRPQKFNWEKDAVLYDYFMMRGPAFIIDQTTSHAPPGTLHLLYTDGTWWLFSHSLEKKADKAKIVSHTLN